jgi:solute carrier family 45 protein 1/2/4
MSKLEIRNGWEESDTPILLILWSVSLGLSAVLMCLALVTTILDVTIVLVAMNGIPWAVTNWVPFVLIGKLTADSERFPDCEITGQLANASSRSGGSLIGLHNIAISAPQILAAGLSGGILGLAQVAGSAYGTGWVLWAGGLASLAAAGVAFRSATQMRGSVQARQM